MATPFTDIYDLFLIGVSDYKLDQLYNISTTDFETYLQGFLIRAVPKFDNCNQDLTYSTTSAQFTETLTNTEKVILADLMTMEWMLKETQDVSQFNLLLNDTDFKHYAEGQNLKEKSAYLDKLREKVNQDMTVYGIKNTPWSDWANGEYGI